MSVSKFTPAELAELRLADAEIDATDAPLEDELDAKLDAIAAAQASGKSADQISARKSRQRRYYQEHREARLAYTRKYHAEHKEEIDRKKHQWYLDHKAEINKRRKDERKKRKEKEKTSSENA